MFNIASLHSVATHHKFVYMPQPLVLHPQQFTANVVRTSSFDMSSKSIWFVDCAVEIPVPGQPCAPSVALFLFFFGHRLDERANIAENGIYSSTLILKHSHHMGITATTSLNFPTVEHSKREAAIPAQASLRSVASGVVKTY